MDKDDFKVGKQYKLLPLDDISDKSKINPNMERHFGETVTIDLVCDYSTAVRLKEDSRLWHWQLSWFEEVDTKLRIQDLSVGMILKVKHTGGYAYKVDSIVRNTVYCIILDDSSLIPDTQFEGIIEPYNIETFNINGFYIYNSQSSNQDLPPEVPEEEPPKKPESPCHCGMFHGDMATVREVHSDWCPMYKDYHIEREYKRWKEELKEWENNS